VPSLRGASGPESPDPQIGIVDCCAVAFRTRVSVRFLPSQDAIGGASFSGRVDLVGEDVFGERFANRQIETCEQLGEGFTFSAFQHS
jgi:hypothetical protein